MSYSKGTLLCCLLGGCNFTALSAAGFTGCAVNSLYSWLQAARIKDGVLFGAGSWGIYLSTAKLGSLVVMPGLLTLGWASTGAPQPIGQHEGLECLFPWFHKCIFSGIGALLMLFPKYFSFFLFFLELSVELTIYTTFHSLLHILVAPLTSRDTMAWILLAPECCLWCTHTVPQSNTKQFYSDTSVSFTLALAGSFTARLKIKQSLPPHLWPVYVWGLVWWFCGPMFVNRPLTPNCHALNTDPTSWTKHWPTLTDLHTCLWGPRLPQWPGAQTHSATNRQRMGTSMLPMKIFPASHQQACTVLAYSENLWGVNTFVRGLTAARQTHFTL